MSVRFAAAVLLSQSLTWLSPALAQPTPVGDDFTVAHSTTQPSDPAVARLFPAAYRDDPLRNLEYETSLGDAPRSGKLQALDTVERTANARALSEEDFLTWMGVVNDLRLVLGTRIEVTEESTEEDFAAGSPRDAYHVYQFLGWVQQEMLFALGEPESGGLHASVEGD